MSFKEYADKAVGIRDLFFDHQYYLSSQQARIKNKAPLALCLNAFEFEFLYNALEIILRFSRLSLSFNNFLTSSKKPQMKQMLCINIAIFRPSWTG